MMKISFQKNVVSSNCFTFYDKCFKQINGSLLSVVIVVIVMLNIDDKIIQKLNIILKFWRKYVDILFLVSRNENLTEILAITNSICPSIQFTIEKDTNYRLSFRK